MGLTIDNAMTSKSEALEKIAQPIKLYLTELANLMGSATQDERDAFELTAQNRLAIAERAIQDVRQNYELPELGDYAVLQLGVAALTNTLRVFNGSASQKDKDLAAIVETAITEVLHSDPGITLRGLLAQARAYQPPNQQN